jgi:hypothetical protein
MKAKSKYGQALRLASTTHCHGGIGGANAEFADSEPLLAG